MDGEDKHWPRRCAIVPLSAFVILGVTVSVQKKNSDMYLHFGGWWLALWVGKDHGKQRHKDASQVVWYMEEKIITRMRTRLISFMAFEEMARRRGMRYRRRDKACRKLCTVYIGEVLNEGRVDGVIALGGDINGECSGCWRNGNTVNVISPWWQSRILCAGELQGNVKQEKRWWSAIALRGQINRDCRKKVEKMATRGMWYGCIGGQGMNDMGNWWTGEMIRKEVMKCYSVGRRMQ